MDVWATNSSAAGVECLLVISAYDLESEWSWIDSVTDLSVLEPNSSTVLRTAMPVPAPDKRTSGEAIVRSGSVVIQARLHTVDSSPDSVPTAKTVVARTSDWPQPYKFIDFAALAVNTEISAAVTISGDHSQISLSATRPVKSLSLELESRKEGEAEVDFSDNAVSGCQASVV